MKLIIVLACLFFIACSPIQDASSTGEDSAMKSLQPNQPSSDSNTEMVEGGSLIPTSEEGIFVEKSNLQKGESRVNEPKQYPSFEDALQFSEDDWKERLTDHEFRVLWRAWTEKPGTGDLLHNKESGVYVTAGCGLPVFSSDTKFESGTGWPSFYDMFNESNIVLKEDYLLGFKRIEVLSTCGEHLGHVFEDGPLPTGLRYCMNSAALDFIASTS